MSKNDFVEFYKDTMSDPEYDNFDGIVLTDDENKINIVKEPIRN